MGSPSGNANTPAGPILSADIDPQLVAPVPSRSLRRSWRRWWEVLTLDRLHDPARRQVRKDAQQQMDMLGAQLPLQNLYVMRTADLPDQLPKLPPYVPAE